MPVHKRKFFLWFIAIASLFAVTSAMLVWLSWQKHQPAKEAHIRTVAPFLTHDPQWADSLLKTMTVEEKVGQLLMLAVDGKKPSPGEHELLELIRRIHPGGLYFMGGSLKKQLADLANDRKYANIPMMYALSAEYGLYFPDDTINENSLLPGIPDISDDSVIMDLAVAVAKQLKNTGIMINFMPSCEYLFKDQEQCNEPSFRIFIKQFEHKMNLYTQKLQENGIMACATAFPDYRIKGISKFSAVEKPELPYQIIRLHPYYDLINSGLSGVLVEHAPMKINDSLRYEITDSLHKIMQFNGMVISNFIQDNYYNKIYTPGQAELMALQSGSDVILMKDHASRVYDMLLRAVHSKTLTEEELDKKVKKILLAKSWGGLNLKNIAKPDYSDMPEPEGEAALMVRKAIESSLVLLSNKNRLIPVKDIANSTFASVALGHTKYREFEAVMDHYAEIAHYILAPESPEKSIRALLNKLKTYNNLIVGVFPGSGLSLHAAYINRLLHELDAHTHLIIAHFGSMESLSLLDHFPVMIHSSCDDKASQSDVAAAVFGGMPLPGQLPYTCSSKFCYGDGVQIKDAVRLKYGMSEEVGIGQEYIYEIDSVVDAAIKEGAFPGCQVFIARKGVVVLNRSYGFHTYDKEIEVRNTDLYDLASVTKVVAGALAAMALYDEGKIALDSTLSFYFDDLDKNAAGKKVRDSRLNYITLRQLMTHTSGLPAALPIARFLSPKWYLACMMELERKRMEQEINDTSEAEDEISPEWLIDSTQLVVAEDSVFKWLFSKKNDKEHQVQLGENFFMREAIIDSIWQLAKQTAVRRNRNYLYSDMNFYLVMKIIEAVTDTAIDQFVYNRFYRPMNLKHICYNPLDDFDKEQIVPTEEEKIFRKQLIHGYVHDPTAALLGGVSGNAGLFSNAEDLGILMQMLLNKGTYGGIRYFSKETVDMFTSVQEEGYRGLGWDHQTKQGMKMLAPSASLSTYGHTGFTGTCVWVDPENELVYVFLSNRIHPKAGNQKINNMHIRQKIQQIIYNAIRKYESEQKNTVKHF